MSQRANNLAQAEATQRADNNREKSVRLIQALHRLLAVAAEPKFCGTIAVEISVKDGVFGRPKTTLVSYDPETKDAGGAAGGRSRGFPEPPSAGAAGGAAS